MSGTCRVYREIRNQFDELNNDEELIKFFNAVLEKRDFLEEQEKEQMEQEKEQKEQKKEQRM